MSRAWQETENGQRMQRGELYYAFKPDLIAARSRCEQAWLRFNSAIDAPRRRRVELWRDIIGDETPLPPVLPDPGEDERQFENDPWVQPPINVDYGVNLRIGAGVFINFNSVFLDTCIISIGARSLVGPNVNFYSGTHPLDPLIRDGIRGPETGKEIHIGEDCWVGGNVTFLPGVSIGKGAVIGAGSVVTKDVPAFHVAAGNPAKVIRRIETKLDPAQATPETDADQKQGAEAPMAEQAS